MNRLCKNCNKEFIIGRQKNKVFCCRSCSSKWMAKTKREKLLKEWLENDSLNYGENTMIKVDSVYREYINNEQQGKCAICGISDIWNGQKLTFVLDHIDGNSSNHSRKNLRLVCPNCDSQLDTYKFKGRHQSSRNYRTYKNK